MSWQQPIALICEIISCAYNEQNLNVLFFITTDYVFVRYAADSPEQGYIGVYLNTLNVTGGGANSVTRGVSEFIVHENFSVVSTGYVSVSRYLNVLKYYYLQYSIS